MLRDAERIVVLTGAGVSAESGVPTFRGHGGLWKSYRPEELATPEAFARDPGLVWEWYRWRRSLVARCAPNPGHHALARLALGQPGRTTIVTQNVDGLHHRAARAEAGERDPKPAFPIEVHGAIHRDRCSGCSHVEDADLAAADPADSGIPRCARCGSPLRPDVVWFGEALDPAMIGAAFAAAEEADLCLVVGTSALVYPAASLPDVTRARGGRVVEVNLDSTPLTPYAWKSLKGPSGSILPRIVP